MFGIPVCILGLAAGVYLLIQVKQLGLGSLYRNLSWLVVALSLMFMTCLAARAVLHRGAERHCSMMTKECLMKDGKCKMSEGKCEMGGGMGHCPMGGSCPMVDGKCSMKGGECPMMGGKCSMIGASCPMGDKCTMPCCKQSHCDQGSPEGCCMKGKGEKQCEGMKAACCHKGTGADSTGVNK